jgi:hypothetical protein
VAPLSVKEKFNVLSKLTNGAMTNFHGQYGLSKAGEKGFVKL